MRNHAILRMAYLSIATSMVTLALKFGAWFLTGSVSLFSDAAESLVNLVAGLIALAALTVAARPAAADHAYGHDKAEYFSSGAEGALILVAAVSIIYTAVGRFLHPAALENLGPGLMVSTLAAALNFATARAMLAVHSICRLSGEGAGDASGGLDRPRVARRKGAPGERKTPAVNLTGAMARTLGACQFGSGKVARKPRTMRRLRFERRRPPSSGAGTRFAFRERAPGLRGPLAPP